jgi:hypothetical protein
LFGSVALSSDNVSQFLAEYVFKTSEIEVEGRTEQDFSPAVPTPDFCQSESRFTHSEILLQRLAIKYPGQKLNAQIIDLLKSLQFNFHDIGL